MIIYFDGIKLISGLCFLVFCISWIIGTLLYYWVRDMIKKYKKKHCNKNK